MKLDSRDCINLKNRAYGGFKAYAQSKLAIILFTRELAKRCGLQSNIKVYALHPGIIENDLERQPLFLANLFITFLKIFSISEEMGV